MKLLLSLAFGPLVFGPLAFGAGEANPPPNPADAVKVTARIDAAALEVGSEYEIVLDIDAGDASTAKSGIVAPILQIDVPPSVRLTGRHLTTQKELARNGYVNEPFERMLESLPATIRFELVAEPAPDERFGLNLLGYVSTRPGEDDAFLRRRLELAVAPGAAGETVSAENSHWGADEGLLNIGDRAALFDLPRADGSRVALEQFLGDKNIVVTTYRAHW